MLNLHKNLKTKNPSSMLLVNPFGKYSKSIFFEQIAKMQNNGFSF